MDYSILKTTDRTLLISGTYALLMRYDKYTAMHSLRVAEFARQIAAVCRFPEPYQEFIYTCGLLHDIGKTMVSPNILNKMSALTDKEYSVIKHHVLYGNRILSEYLPSCPEYALCARYHHERLDGTGYPDSLLGMQIPEYAKLIAVADVSDVLFCGRVYCKPLAADAIKNELLRCSGTQFDLEFSMAAILLLDNHISP